MLSLVAKHICIKEQCQQYYCKRFLSMDDILLTNKIFFIFTKVHFHNVLCILKGNYDESYIVISCVVMWMLFVDRYNNILLQKCWYSTQDLEFQYIRYQTFCKIKWTRTWPYKAWKKTSVIIQNYSNTEMHHRNIKP